jgi:hypothetical protein
MAHCYRETVGVNKDFSYSYYMGIDSGLNGGIVLMKSSTKEIIHKQVMPTLQDGTKNLIDVRELVKTVAKLYQAVPGFAQRCMIVIEKTHARPGLSTTGQFSLGRSLGHLEAVVAALEANVIWITPGKWMKHLNDFSTKKDPAERQFDCAKILWPMVDFKASPRCKKQHDGMIAAALIAYVGRKIVADSADRTKQ